MTRVWPTWAEKSVQNNRRTKDLSRTWTQREQLLRGAADTMEGDGDLTDPSSTPGLPDNRGTTGTAEPPGVGEEPVTHGAVGGAIGAIRTIKAIRTGALSRRRWSVAERRWYDKGPQEGG